DDAGLLQLRAAPRSLPGGALVSLRAGDALDHHAALLRQHVHDPAGPAAVLAAHHLDLVVLLDLDPWHDLQHLRRERDDLHEPFLTELPRHRPEDAGPPRVLLLVDQHDRVVVELDVGAVLPPTLLRGTHHDTLHDLTLLHRAARQRVLHRTHDDVAEARVSTARPTEDTDHQDLLGPRVVRDPAPRLLLDHLAFSTTSTTRQRFVFDNGRVSMRRTVSPTCASPASSCATSFRE